MIYSSEYIFIFCLCFIPFKMPFPWPSHWVIQRCNDKTLGIIDKSDLFEDVCYIYDPIIPLLQNGPSLSGFNAVLSELCYWTIIINCLTKMVMGKGPWPSHYVLSCLRSIMHDKRLQESKQNQYY